MSEVKSYVEITIRKRCESDVCEGEMIHTKEGYVSQSYPPIFQFKHQCNKCNGPCWYEDSYPKKRIQFLEEWA